jgi:hydrogenase maturation protease
MRKDAKCVLGIGSPHGDDQVGWLVVERLRKSLPKKILVETIKQPIEVMQFFSGCECAILVDACKTGAPLGTVTRLCWPDARIDQCSGCSSHGFGLASSLKLAERLGVLPPRVIILGIEIPVYTSKNSLHEAAEGAMVEAERLVHEELFHEEGDRPTQSCMNTP